MQYSNVAIIIYVVVKLRGNRLHLRTVNDFETLRSYLLREEIAQLCVLPEKILRPTDYTYNMTVLAE